MLESFYWSILLLTDNFVSHCHEKYQRKQPNVINICSYIYEGCTWNIIYKKIVLFSNLTSISTYCVTIVYFTYTYYIYLILFLFLLDLFLVACEFSNIHPYKLRVSPGEMIITLLKIFNIMATCIACAFFTSIT